MMNLPVPTKEQAEEFRRIYENEYGIALTPEEAMDGATRVLQLYYIVTYYSPRPGAKD
jgi:hypothetical protein